jgi:hypothetical protein
VEIGCPIGLLFGPIRAIEPIHHFLDALKLP